MSSSKPAAASGGQELQRYQKEMLGKLRSLRESLETERAPFAKMQAERDQAVAAKAQVHPDYRAIVRPHVFTITTDPLYLHQLEESNEKMAYRIKHLLRAIDPDFAASQVLVCAAP